MPNVSSALVDQYGALVITGTAHSVDNSLAAGFFFVLGLISVVGARWLLARERRIGRRGRGPVVLLWVLAAASFALGLYVFFAPGSY